LDDASLVEGGEDKVIKILVLVFGGRFDHGGDGGDGGAAAIRRAEGWRSFEASSGPSKAGVVPR